MGRTRSSQFFKTIEIAVRRAFIRWLSSRREPEQPKLPLELGETPTILFLRQDRLGDAIVSTPVIVALQRRYPKAKFLVLLGDNNKEIAPLLPFDCETFVFRKRPLHDIRMLWGLRRRKIDVLIDLMDNPSATSSMMVAAIAARYSVGLDKENASIYNVLVPLIDRQRYHIARRLVELLRPFGIDPERVALTPSLKVTQVDAVPGRIGMVISAGKADHYLSATASAHIAAETVSRGYASELVIFFHPKDHALADEILRMADDPRVVLSPTTSTFAEYVQQLRTCEIIVTPDTSAVHVCSAYRIPLVAMYQNSTPGLHFWTPIDVPFEMVRCATLGLLDPQPVLDALGRLHEGVAVETKQHEHVA